ncbi:FIST N-terminal domain-containing protein [Rhodoblastus sp.]|uniref:FIST N-terminal domain-containing protein n=1 Tax=Rhodoblastus sp. TaxID=1962975 RepID=UPI003F9D151D
MGERRADGVVIASTSASSAEAAASEIAAAIKGQLAASGEKSEEALAGLVCFVCSSFDAARFSAEIRSTLPGSPIFGCTTAGELTPAGWASHSIVAIGFLRRHFTLVAHMMEELSHFGVEEGRASIAEARAALLAAGPYIEPDHCFGLLLIDGMCRREEAVISALYSALDDIPVVGGSAGDGMSFEKTWMIRDGEVFRDAALLLLFHTDLPFAPFKCDYFEPSSAKMVVTDADIELRIVRELNAEPAATEYAHQVGLVESKLDSTSFASHPVLVGVGGQYYARSIQKVNSDGSLSFFCAIDEGLVLTVAKTLDAYESTLATFERLEAELGAVSLYIGFDCVLRRLAAERQQIAHRLSELYRRRRVIGFNTYGEQYRSMHVNQTFTGIALGYRRAEAQETA